MALCEQCGSIQIVRARSQTLDKIVEALSSRRPFVCRRCGWRGRRQWADTDLLRQEQYGTGAEPDPSLVILDQSPSRRRRKTRPRKRGGNRADKSESDTSGLRLTRHDVAESGAVHEPIENPRQRSFVREPRSSFKHARRREIVATVAMTALTMFVAAMIILSGSCNSGLGE